MAVGQRDDKAAYTFLKDLSKRGIVVDQLVECLKVIKCQGALNFFLKGTSKSFLSLILIMV